MQENGCQTICQRRFSESQRAHQGKIPMVLIANAKCNGRHLDLWSEAGWKNKLKVVLLLKELSQHLRQGPFISPSVLPVSSLASSWKLVWLPQPHCFPELHYPQSQTDLRFLLTSLPLSSFMSFSPTAKFLVIYSRDTILQLELF